MKITVKETGYLQLDPAVIHPFVRVHIIDMKTGKYLAKSDPEQPGVTNKESITLFNSEGDVDDRHKVDFILPVSTTFHDMRITGNNNCKWDEEFIINERAQYIC